jgi:hypothetical protein
MRIQDLGKTWENSMFFLDLGMRMRGGNPAGGGRR